MVTYVQIGKNPRMAINGTVANIRNDFIKQIPSWKKLVPIYFYSSAKGSDRKGVLVPVKWVSNDGKYTRYDFFWVSEYEYWSIDFGRKSKVRHGTFGWSDLMDVLEMYNKKGFVI